MTKYSTKEQREAAVKKIELDCMVGLSKVVELAENAMVRVSERSIELSLRNKDKKHKNYGYPLFASEVTIYADIEHGYFGKQTADINFGSSGSFSPENKVSYWRTIHAAEILRHWDVVIPIVNKACQEYTNLVKEIMNENPA